MLPLGSTGFIDDSLEQTLHGFRFQRASSSQLNIVNHLFLPLRIIDFDVQLLLDLANLDGTFAPLVQKFDQFQINLIDPLPPAVDFHSAIKKKGRGHLLPTARNIASDSYLHQ